MTALMTLQQQDYPNLARRMAQGERLVICLCAAWCSSCKEYMAAFANLAPTCPDYQFIWLDIEDHADLVDEIDIANFPTILILRGTTPLFLGEMRPDTAILRRLLDSLANTTSTTPAMTFDLYQQLRKT